MGVLSGIISPARRRHTDIIKELSAYIGIIFLNENISLPSNGWNLKTPARITIFQVARKSETR